MKTDSELDDMLTANLDEAPLADNGFTNAVATRLRDYRRRRQWILSLVTGLVSVCVALNIYLSPEPLFQLGPVAPDSVAAIALLVAACCAVVILLDDGWRGI